MSKVLTLRMPDEDIAQLEEVALVDGIPVAEVMRRGVQAYVAQRRSEPDYAEGMRQRIEELQGRVNELKAAAANPSESDARRLAEV